MRTIRAATVPGARSMIRRGAALALCLAAMPVSGSDTGAEGDAEWGAYLASGCNACHAEPGGRIPSLAGLSAEDLLTAMHAFRSGARDNPAMVTVARGLSEQELAALAAHFGSLSQDPATQEDPE